MKIGSIFLFLIILIMSASADVIPVGKNVFIETKTSETVIIDSDFILVVLDDKGVGRYYYIDSKEAGNSVIWSFRVAAGHSPVHTTKSGIYRIYYKKKKWMSTIYPDPSGINNMDYSMFFNGNIALHQGSIWNLSHGCIHLRKTDAQRLFDISKIGTPVIITRNSYIPHLTQNEKGYIFEGNVPKFARY